jgi:hypothetical protein
MGYWLLGFDGLLLLGTLLAQVVRDARLAQLAIAALAGLQTRITHLLAAGLALDQAGVAHGFAALVATASAALTEHAIAG